MGKRRSRTHLHLVVQASKGPEEKNWFLIHAGTRQNHIVKRIVMDIKGLPGRQAME